MFKKYLLLTKPGIIMGNVITAIGGFALASKGKIDFSLLIAALVGLSFIIASACVYNNYFDRKIDEKMARTKNRALVCGTISTRNALLFAFILVISGILTLASFTNFLTLCMALTGFIFYVAVYGIAKYRTVYGTLIGSIAGAMPPVVGYCAVTNQCDTGALLLFLIIALWQMPHFFAIALYRLQDYSAAAMPVLPIIKGILATKVQMFFYTLAFAIAALLPTYFGYAGYIYLGVAGFLSIAWLWICVGGFKCKNDQIWAKKMFRFSLVTVTLLCVMISIDLP